MNESPEGEGKQREMGERLSARRWLSEGFLCMGSAVTQPNRDWERAGKVQLGARRCQAEGWPGPFVPLALSHGFSDTC